MGFPANESSVSQIIEKLDSLPNSARDTAVNNSIVSSDNFAGLGESILKLYSESSPSAREAIADMFELACNEPFDNWLDKLTHLRWILQAKRVCSGIRYTSRSDRRCPRFGRMDRLRRCRTRFRISGNRAGDGSYRLRPHTQHRPARQGYGLHRRLDGCSPRSRLQLGSGRGGAYRRGMPGRPLGRPNHRRLQIYL